MMDRIPVTQQQMDDLPGPYDLDALDEPDPARAARRAKQETRREQLAALGLAALIRLHLADPADWLAEHVLAVRLEKIGAPVEYEGVGYTYCVVGDLGDREVMAFGLPLRAAGEYDPPAG
jgi:hypothetical protein